MQIWKLKCAPSAFNVSIEWLLLTLTAIQLSSSKWRRYWIVAGNRCNNAQMHLLKQPNLKSFYLNSTDSDSFLERQNYHQSLLMRSQTLLYYLALILLIHFVHTESCHLHLIEILSSSASILLGASAKNIFQIKLHAGIREEVKRLYFSGVLYFCK